MRGTALARGNHNTGGRGRRGGGRGGRGGRGNWNQGDRRGGKYQGGRGYSKPNNTIGAFFKEETKEMSGYVFQTLSEQQKQRKFQDTMDALKVFLPTIYKNIMYLKPLFYRLKQLDVREPEQKFLITKSTDQSGVVTYKQTPTDFESAVYNERINTWIKATDAPDSTLQPLYNSIWGQCSKLM